MGKKRTLHIAAKVKLPIEAVTQTFGFMGIRGAGKTYAATKLAEEMLLIGAQVVALDPVGKWWGLRLSNDGKSPGFNIPVLGGLHGDIPLDPKSGELVAQTIIETGASAIIDVSQMRKGQRKEFVTAFCEALFYLRSQDPAAMHLFFEEAHVFAPQMGKGQERMLGAVEDIVRLGRNHGIGSTLVDQRPQSVNKNVLNQIECLFAMRLNAKHERTAIMDWVRHKGVDLKEMADSLPTLGQGEAMMWSPSWLERFEKILILEKQSFDASATPKVGTKLKTRKLKKLDLAYLEQAMSGMIEQAEADDPKALRRRIAMLERDLAAAGKTLDEFKNGVTSSVMQREEKFQQREEEFEAVQNALAEASEKITYYESMVTRASEFRRQAVRSLQVSSEAIDAIIDNLDQPLELAEPLPELPIITATVTHTEIMGGNGTANPPPARLGIGSDKPSPLFNAPTKPTTLAFDADRKLKKIENAILDALSWWKAVGVDDPSRRQVGFISGYSHGSSHFKNNVGALKNSKYLDYPKDRHLELTLLGESKAMAVTPPADTRERHKMFAAQLTGIQESLLRVALAHYPNDLSREELGQASGYAPASSHFKNNVGALKTLGTLRYPSDGHVAATDLMFLA